MPLGYGQLRHESFPGNELNTPTLSTKTLYVPLDELSVDQGPQFLERDDELRGLSEPIPVIPEAYEPKWSLSSRLYPDTLGMALACAFGITATGETGATHYVATAGNGVITDPDSTVIPTGATRHVWTAPLGPLGASPKTAQIIAAYKDQSLFLKAKGASVNQIEITTPERGGAQISLQGIAAYADAFADPSLTPAYETLATRPFMRGGQSIITWLTGTATPDGVSYTIANPVENTSSLGIESKYADVVEKSNEGLVLLTGSIGKRQLDVDDFNALRDATEFAAKTRWRSDTVIASGYRYSFWIEMSAAQYVGGNLDALSNKRRLGGSFNFRAARNASASVTLTLVNNVTSYA